MPCGRKAAIADDVSPARLKRFFVKDDEGAYTVTPTLRSDVVFTVQNIVADPPFSRRDMISCRNLLIYLDPEPQQKVIALFAFALRNDGVLLLGNAETTGTGHDLFSVTSKSNRLYARLPRQGTKPEKDSPPAAPHITAAPDKAAPAHFIGQPADVAGVLYKAFRALHDIHS